MCRKILFLILCLCFSSKVQASCTLEASIEGPITISTYEYMKRVFEETEEKQCDSILILMNTPGGVLTVTRKVVSLILNSPKPVLCLISPAGAHAASAGAIIHQACHVSGALKTTTLGAATPITGDGKDIQKDLRRKIINDMVSWVSGIAKTRKRNQKFVKDIVEQAKSVTAEEAFHLKAIDFVGTSKEEFLKFSEKKEVLITSENKRIKVKVGTLKPTSMNLKENFLKFISNPLVAGLIFMGGLFLIYFEITNPGFGVPGMVGGISLILSFINLEVLGVRWASVLLMILGMILFVIEVFTPTFGILSLFGAICFIIGGFLFFDPNKTMGMEIPHEALFVISSVFVLLSVGLAYLAWNSTKNRLKIDTAFQILDKEGVVKSIDTGNSLSGQIEIGGEIWRFHSQNELKIGDRVKVKKTSSQHSLTLEVEKA